MPAGVDPDEFLARLGGIRRDILARHAATDAGRRAERLLARLEATLSRPVRAAILGEVNSGKTTFANRLLGSDLLATDVIENTRLPVVIGWAPRPELHVRLADGTRRPVAGGRSEGEGSAGSARRIAIEIGIPRDALRRIELVDTPGLVAEAPLRGHRIVPGRPVDIAVWCTIATQAWRASEIAHWRALGYAPARSVLVATRADLLAPADREKVGLRLAREAGPLFGSIVLVPRDGQPGAVPVAFELLASAELSVRQDRCRRAAAIVGRHLALLEPAGRFPHGQLLAGAEA